MIGISAFLEEAPQSFLALSIMWGKNKKAPAMEQEEAPHLTMLVPWSGLPSLPNCET